MLAARISLTLSRHSSLSFIALGRSSGQQHNSTFEYRRDLVKRQITLCKDNVNTLYLETQKIREKLKNSITPEQLHELDNRLSVIINKSDYEHKLTFQKKLNNLLKGHFLLPNNIDKYINLLDCNLTQQQNDFLNFHLFQRYTSIDKNTENEILHQNILKLWDKKVISVKPEFHDFLKLESIKNRFNKKNKKLSLLNHQIKIASKELRNHANITIKNR